jgi:hypothetical protein
VRAVSDKRGKQMLYGVNGAVFHYALLVVAACADVIGNNAAVRPGNIHALLQDGVVYGKARDFFHFKDRTFLRKTLTRFETQRQIAVDLIFIKICLVPEEFPQFYCVNTG